jgi:hypothetical protein
MRTRHLVTCAATCRPTRRPARRIKPRRKVWTAGLIIDLLPGALAAFTGLALFSVGVSWL